MSYCATRSGGTIAPPCAVTLWGGEGTGSRHAVGKGGGQGPAAPPFKETRWTDASLSPIGRSNVCATCATNG